MLDLALLKLLAQRLLLLLELLLLPLLVLLLLLGFLLALSLDFFDFKLRVALHLRAAFRGRRLRYVGDERAACVFARALLRARDDTPVLHLLGNLRKNSQVL